MVFESGAEFWQSNGVVIHLAPCEINQANQMRPNIHRFIVQFEHTEIGNLVLYLLDIRFLVANVLDFSTFTEGSTH